MEPKTEDRFVADMLRYLAKDYNAAVLPQLILDSF